MKPASGAPAATLAGFNYAALKNWVFLVFPLLVVLGNVELWLGASSLTLPMALVVLLPIGLVEVLRARQGHCAAQLLPFLFMYLLLIGLGVLAAWADPMTSWRRNLVSLLPWVTAGLTLFCFKDVRLPADVSRVMRCAGACLALLVILKFAWVFLPIWWQVGRAAVFEQKGLMGLPLGQSNFLAVFLMFFSVFAWRSHKALWLLMLFAVTLTLSRFGLAFTLLAAACVVLLGYVRLSILVLLLGLAGALLIVPVLLFPVQLSSLFGFLPKSLEARFDLWTAAMAQIVAAPFWGGGPGGFTTYLELIGWPRLEWGAHNFVLAQWIEFGCLGLLVYLLILLRFLLVPSAMSTADERLVKLGGVLLLFYGLFENVVGQMAFELLFAYLLCLLSARRA